MAHVTSYKAGGAVGVLKHDERSEHDHVKERKNESIDSNRTHLNYNLAAKRSGTLMQHINRVCDENNVRLSNRKDLNVMCSWVVTVPKSVPMEQHPLFFKTCYDFFEERYGKKYTLSAMVHLDETTPHMHYCFLPVGYDKKNDRYTVSSKLVLTRTELQHFHSDLSSHLKQIFGYDVGIENGETAKKGNRTTEELKYHSAKKRLNQIKEHINTAEMRLNALQDDFEAQKGKYDFIKIEVSGADYRWIRDNVCCTVFKNSKGDNYFVVPKSERIRFDKYMNLIEKRNFDKKLHL